MLLNKNWDRLTKSWFKRDLRKKLELNFNRVLFYLLFLLRLVCQFSSDSCLKLLNVSSFPNNKYYSLNFGSFSFLIFYLFIV